MGKLSVEIRALERQQLEALRQKFQEEVRVRQGPVVEERVVPGKVWKEAKERAEAAGEAWDVWVKDVEVTGRCALTGEELRGRGWLERKDRRKGWTKENVWVVGERASRMVREWDPEEAREVVDQWVRTLT